MMSTCKRGAWVEGGGGLKICHLFLDFFVFVFKNLLFNFAGDGVWGYTIGHFLRTSQMFDP